MTMLKRTRKGFTLIELMIVVAIIGILAAVAVPAFIKYIKDSKTAEAKENIGTISNGALAYYQSEHALSADGLEVFTRSYPWSADNLAVPAIALTAPGTKTDPTAVVGDWNKRPWTDLKFSVSKPFYYQYNYIPASGSSREDNKSFVAYAVASLSTVTPDSCFSIVGRSSETEPVIGAIVDIHALNAACTAPTVANTII